MSGSSFANVDTAIEQASEEVAPSNALVAENFYSNEGLEGGDVGQVQVPRIFIVHGVGDLSEKFQAGQLVLNAEQVLKQPLEITVVRQKMFMLEDIPFNSPDRGERMPKKFATVQEARNAGFIPKWESYENPAAEGMPVVVNCADMDILVKGNAEDIVCPLDFNGEGYFFARLRGKGKDFKMTAEKVKTSATFSKGTPLTGFRCVLTTVRLKEGKNFVWRLNYASKGKNTPEFVDFARQLL